MALTYPPTSGYKYQQDKGWGYSEAYNRLVITPAPPQEAGLIQPFSLDFYLYVHSLPSNASVLSTISPGSDWRGNGFIFYLRSGTTSQGFHIGISDQYQRGGNPEAGAWMHIEITYDGATLKLYKDAVDTVSAAVSNPIAGEALFSTIGGLGSIADVEINNLRLWGHARTSAQVADDMVTDYGAGKAGLIAGFSLDSPEYFVAAEYGEGDAILEHNAPTDYAAELLNSTWLQRPLVPETRDVYADLAPKEVVYHGQISGMVTVKGDPAAQRVLAFVRSTGKKVAETTSDSDGNYTLTGLNPEAAHYVVALDKNLEYNGVIADNITPEVPA